MITFIPIPLPLLLQMTVSIVFFLEILGLLLFHLFHSQYKMFFKNRYYWYLLILGVGGVVAAVPVEGLYDPQSAGTAVVIFQVGKLYIFVHTHDLYL